VVGGVVIAVVVLLGGGHSGVVVACRCSWHGAGVVVSALIGGVIFMASVLVLARGGWHCHSGVVAVLLGISHGVFCCVSVLLAWQWAARCCWHGWCLLPWCWK